MASWKTPFWNVIAEPGGPLNCLLTCFCPCVTYGINVSKLGDAKAEVMCSGEFTPACCLYCFIGYVGCPCVVHIPTRKYIRKKYGLKEPALGMLEDVLMTWCCSCCAILQDYNEIAIAEGADKGAVLTDLKKAKEVAAADVKKEAQAHTSSTGANMQSKDDKEEPAKEDTKEEPAKEDTKEEPAKEDTKEEPAEEDTKEEPAKEDTKEEPAKEDTNEEPAKEEKAEAPKADEKEGAEEGNEKK